MTDLDRYLTDQMIEKSREALTFGIMGCGCCGENPPDELDHLDFDVARAHVAARASLAAVLPEIVQAAKAEALREAADAIDLEDAAKQSDLSDLDYYWTGRESVTEEWLRARAAEMLGVSS